MTTPNDKPCAKASNEPQLAMLTVRLYADDVLIATTDDEAAWCAVLNRIMKTGEPRI